MKINTNIPIYYFAIIGACLMLSVGCKKDDSNSVSLLPVITTTEVTNITSNTATSGGAISSDGGFPITASGVCYSSNSSQEPTIANDTTVNIAIGGSFVSNISNLTASATYLIRAYATNINGTAYGVTRLFTTGKGIPLVATTAVTSIGVNTVKSGGKILYNGGDSITLTGVCWSTNLLPTINDNVINDTVNDTVSIVNFVDTLTNLMPNTVYYIRAYAINNTGTGYGETISFRTQQDGGAISFTSVEIPAGTFTMGSQISEANRNSNETQYQVTLDAFKISKYEITNAQFAAFLNAKGIGSDGKDAAGTYPSQTLIYKSSGSYNWGLNYSNGAWNAVLAYQNHPVILVTWYGAAEFAKYVGGRLPTEAEWEYACRANTTNAFNTGDCITNLDANYNWFYSYSSCTNTITNNAGATQTVDTYLGNGYGLFNMHGNVGEWCSDWYGDYPTTDQTNPTGALIGSERVVRGGSWDSGAKFCRSANRNSYSPDGYDYSVGFRVVVKP